MYRLHGMLHAMTTLQATTRQQYQLHDYNCMAMLHDCMVMLSGMTRLCYELHDNNWMVKCGNVHGKAACLKRIWLSVWQQLVRSCVARVQQLHLYGLVAWQCCYTISFFKENKWHGNSCMFEAVWQVTKGNLPEYGFETLYTYQSKPPSTGWWFIWSWQRKASS